jgi:hypothetical protein
MAMDELLPASTNTFAKGAYFSRSGRPGGSRNWDFAIRAFACSRSVFALRDSLVRDRLFFLFAIDR